MREAVLAEAIVQPEISKKLEFVRLSADELLDKARAAEAAIFAAAERWEYDYRDKALQAGARGEPDTWFDRAVDWFEARLSWIERKPFLSQIIAVVLVPVLSLTPLAVILWSAIVIPGKDQAAERWDFFLTRLPWAVAVAVVIGFGVLLLHRLRRLAGVVRSWSASVILPILVSGFALFFGGLPSSWWWAAAIVPWAVASIYLGVVAVTVVPSADDIAKLDVARAAFAKWRKTLLHEGFLPFMRTTINDADAFHSTELTVDDAPGLTQFGQHNLHQPTAAGIRLAGLIGTVSGGTLALSGPRGAGKSDLLKAFCAGRYRDDTQLPDLTVLVAAPVEYAPQEFVLHLFAATCRASIDYVRQVDGLAAVSAEELHSRTWTGRLRRAQAARIAFGDARSAPTDLTDLTLAAHANLMQIKYVQTYSGETSTKGGFKGFEAAAKAGVSFAGRPATYPELVAKFREFAQGAVAVLAAHAAEAGRGAGRVIIGIDELDRIGTGEPARRFLNEVKTIFDVPGCFYLVSVSTEAQHDFELSGSGLRSVLDSSFDEVVRVDYLDFHTAKKLLRRYVVGLSEQFMALAYVFSGGLARQLVRATRAIVEVGRAYDRPSLNTVTQDLAMAELTRICQVTTDALTVLDDRDDLQDLLLMLDDRPVATVPTEDLHAYGDKLLATCEHASRRARELRDLVSARVSFLATVLGLFDAGLSADRMSEIDFDALAKARRYVESSPATGQELLRRIR